MRSIRISLPVLLLVCLIRQAAPTALAGALDLYVPSISGEDSPPGFAGAMRLNSLSIESHGYSITKEIDSATPQIVTAVANGTPLSTTRLLLYNTSVPGSAPAAELPFANTFATSSQIQGNSTEADTFAATVPAKLYLDITGITGADPTPGHPTAIRIDTFSLSDGTFSILKPVDSASPQILSAVASGTPLAGATLLLYDSLPEQQPYATAQFQNVFATSWQVLGTDASSEQDTFTFTTITPEPGAGMFLAASAGAAALRRRKPKLRD